VSDKPSTKPVCGLCQRESGYPQRDGAELRGCARVVIADLLGTPRVYRICAECSRDIAAAWAQAAPVR
jgi:hypothetical protein